MLDSTVKVDVGSLHKVNFLSFNSGQFLIGRIVFLCYINVF